MYFIIVLYQFITWLTAKSEKVEKSAEGKPIDIIEDGVFSIDNITKDSQAKDEFFSELRQYNVEHLGQIKIAILETNGSISVVLYSNDELQPGLAIF